MTSKCPIIRAKCPRSAEGCPCWHKVISENPSTREQKVLEDCLFRLLPFLLTEVIRASNRPAAAIESTRNEMVRGLAAIASNVGKLPSNVVKQVKHDG